MFVIETAPNFATGSFQQTVAFPKNVHTVVARYLRQ